jgi:two-component system cell cycle sensor histidine kinase/response regulator CckA
MSKKLPFSRALQITAVSCALCAVYELARFLVVPLSLRTRAAVILLLASLIFLIECFLEGKYQIFSLTAAGLARKTRLDQVRIQAAALGAAANGMVITGRNGTIEWVNPAFTRMTGFSLEDVVGKNPRVLKSGKHNKDFYDDLWSTISSGRVWQGEMTNCRKDGTLYIEEMTITPVASDGGAITHYIAVKQDISRRKRTEEALRLAEEQYRGIFDDAIIGIFRSTPDGRFLMMNPAMAKMLRGDSPAQSIEEIWDISLLYDDPSERRELRRKLETDGTLRNFEREFHRRDGSEVWLSLNLRCIYGTDHHPEYYEGTAEDITERKLLDRQLRQAQKMEVVGRLAGGVAHDFNNMLGVIIGYCELLRLRPKPAKTTGREIEQIHLAAKRATSLTQQLLAFSRKQITQPCILDLNEVLSKLSSMLQRLIGEDIELTLRLSRHDVRVNADASQIDQIIMNLAVNARDAMPGGGQLMIETDTCELDAGYSMKHRPVRSGRYVRLTITDTGSGMDRETMSHLFEPFFTTKELGRGTGLGLSIVYGIVKHSDGYIWVYSEPGQGTSFKIYLPLPCAAVAPAVLPAPVESVNGSEHVLVVEDDPGFRSMVVGFLKGLGYTVLEAENGERALAMVAAQHTPVQVLLTDIVMPKMSGRELADRLTSSLPTVKVLYTSGYTHDGVVQSRALREGEAFLQKPFALSELSRKLREIIGEGKAAARSVSAAS